jgi:hypothetical protein
MPDNVQPLEMHLASGEAVHRGDVVDLAPEVGDSIREKQSIVVRFLPEDNQVSLRSLGGRWLTVGLDQIVVPPWDIPEPEMDARDIWGIRDVGCSHLAVNERGQTCQTS